MTTTSRQALSPLAHSPCSRIPRWIGGERVTREIYMDDGTWMREGDKCLALSPLRRGVVLRRDSERPDAIWVRWDDGEEHRYLDHGVDADNSANVRISDGGNKT